MFPSILIQLENGPNECYFYFYFVLRVGGVNLLRKKSVKQKIKKRWPKTSKHLNTQITTAVIILKDSPCGAQKTLIMKNMFDHNHCIIELLDL